jgi:hypothetical protein
LWIESGLSWAYSLMQRLDHSYMMRTSDCPQLKRKPSEYMREMYCSTQPMEMPEDESILEAMFKMINAEVQLFSYLDTPSFRFCACPRSEIRSEGPIRRAFMASIRSRFIAQLYHAKAAKKSELRPERRAAAGRCRGPNRNGARFRHADVQRR